jgi:hypothetical protein
MADTDTYEICYFRFCARGDGDDGWVPVVRVVEARRLGCELNEMASPAARAKRQKRKPPSHYLYLYVICHVGFESKYHIAVIDAPAGDRCRWDTSPLLGGLIGGEGSESSTETVDVGLRRPKKNRSRARTFPRPSVKLSRCVS